MRGAVSATSALTTIPAAGRTRVGGVLARYVEPVPAQRVAVLRVLVGGYALAWLLVRFPHLLSVSRLDDARFDGLGALWFLGRPVPAGLSQAVLVATVLAGVGYVVGWRWRGTGPAFAVLFLVITTYRNAWGQIFHTENLVAMHLLLLCFAPAAVVLSVDGRRRRRSRPLSPLRADVPGWPVRLCTLVTVLAYVIAGWAKLRNGGMAWLSGDVLHTWIAHDNLRKVLFGDPASPVASVVLAHAWLFPLFAAITLAVELGAPVALVRGWLRVAWALSAWLFHVGVLVIMAIAFPYQLSGIAFASMFRVERLARAVGVTDRQRPARACHREAVPEPDDPA